MKIILTIAYLATSLTLVSAKTITDMAGRIVNIPDEISRILPYDAKMSLLLFPVAYEKMAAKALLPGNKELKFINNSYNKMPQVDIKNIEEVLSCNPQLIIAGAYIDKEGYAKFEKIQKRTHIPIVIIDLNINKLDLTYQFLGKLLATEAKCEACAQFLKTTYSNSTKLINKNTLKNKSVYYTIGESGLMTDPSGSRHTEVLDYLHTPNVAKVPIPTGGHAQVNMEQVFIWNPDVIFCAGFKGNKNAVNTLKKSPKWKNIKAVQNKQLYKVPSLPVGWFDHPPSVNRIPGIIWLCELFYHQSAAQTKANIKEFYQLFYQYKLSDENYQSLFI